ncbi:hypothetical protein ENSA5_37810 [Enhygromyxa salina]|uniref:Ig-like domain-containing protein n=1 Tax=Enhygromyxa salina TaxID=215803 RepID=A0A2S9XS15_9BACT|nr:hypothetical protein [Enhygromyxa salina]PRP95648.1 hypothetical protein ENSA5_37810 [Enhygromyxa salina]
MHPGLLAPIVVLVCAALASPASASAANEAHVRTPVLWPSQCARVVDRSVDAPIVHFDYTIPVEDTEPTLDELPDSRTHQFVALCRQRPVSELLPPWITRDDVDRSVELGLVEADEVSYREILDESTIWTDCFTRITADDDRRPISFEQAAAGVEWDTSAVGPGVYSVSAYTFEPTLNLWRDRPGFVKILDDPDDPEQDLPAIALLVDEQALDPGAPIVVEACVDVLGPAQVELEWARFAPSLDWQALDTLTVDDDGPLSLDLRAPIAAADSEILVRARITDARGRESIGHATARVSVLPCPLDGPTCVEPTPEGEGEGEGEGQRGGCSVGSPLGTGGGGLVGLVFLVLVRVRGRARIRKSARPSAWP